MAWDADTKRQRDKFLAFAFASSDLFIEVTPDEKVSYDPLSRRWITL